MHDRPAAQTDRPLTGSAVTGTSSTTWFACADESAHYGFSVGMLLQQYREQLRWDEGIVDELGTGDASAIADVVAALPDLRVRGFDISETSVAQARRNIAARGLADRYTVELADFFDSADSTGTRSSRTVISNPPYIPAPDRDILMPELWGGVHGNDLALMLLKADYDTVILAVPSYADPVTTLGTAVDLGYRVVNFLAMGLDFGPYSAEPKVAGHIRRLVAEGRGWAGEDEYLVAVTLLTRVPEVPGDRLEHLLRTLHVA